MVTVYRQTITSVVGLAEDIKKRWEQTNKRNVKNKICCRCLTPHDKGVRIASSFVEKQELLWKNRLLCSLSMGRLYLLSLAFIYCLFVWLVVFLCKFVFESVFDTIYHRFL